MPWHTPEPANRIMKEMEPLMGMEVSLRAYVFDVQNCDQKNIACGNEQTYIDILCDDNNWRPQVIAAHAHNVEENAFFGQICFDPQFLRLTKLQVLEDVVAHEVAHFGQRGHNKDHDRLTRNLVNGYRRLHPSTLLQRAVYRLKAWQLHIPK